MCNSNLLWPNRLASNQRSEASGMRDALAGVPRASNLSLHHQVMNSAQCVHVRIENTSWLRSTLDFGWLRADCACSDERLLSGVEENVASAIEASAKREELSKTTENRLCVCGCLTAIESFVQTLCARRVIE